MPGGKYVIGELINRCCPLVNHIVDNDMEISGDEVQDMNKLIENTSLSYEPNESNCIKEAEDYYLVKKYYQFTKKGYILYKDEFNQYINEQKEKLKNN